MRVLFVCHGNICRSPMAEFILKALVRSRGLEGAWHIESAAVSTEEIGNPIIRRQNAACRSTAFLSTRKSAPGRSRGPITTASTASSAWTPGTSGSSSGSSPDDPDGKSPPHDVLHGRRPGRRGPVVYGGFRKQPSKISWKVVKRCLCKGKGYWKQYPSPSLVITFSA
jgi:Protein-tyrosine-phosphatase